mmetsp:Transcript_252/g.402  ORF Transcript_252/g.402 Transcript_252/m.402 type:complete len:206 (+) Transcript_252:79-696(+)
MIGITPPSSSSRIINHIGRKILQNPSGISRNTSHIGINISSFQTMFYPKNHYYSSLSKEEEEKEKLRISILSQVEKEKELRTLDKEIARLNTLRGINTGELYTFRGKFKALSRDYGIAFLAYYWTVWTSTAILTYGAIELGGIDAMALLAKVDTLTGYEISNKVDPTLGTIGLTVAVNELIEPIRLPMVVLTTKPVIDTLYPKNY